MRRLSPWERWWAVCVLASLLVHLLLLWGVDRWLNAQKAESRIAAQLEPPDQRPFRLKKWLALPPGKHAFAGRPAFRISPRPLKGLSPGSAQEYLERGIPQGVDTQIAPADLYSSYQGIDTLFAHPDWEQSALQAWRDSFSLALKEGKEWEGPEPLNPFDVETLARGQGRSVVVLDSTGQFLRGYCTIPIYGIYVPMVNRMNANRPIRNTYADFYHGLKNRFAELSQTTPLRLELDARYRVDADTSLTVPPDPIHRKGEFPHRDALTLEQLRQYPVVSLQFIDVESTAVLAQYMVEGGFALMDQRQLDRLAAELDTHADLQVRQLDLDANHLFMSIYYTLAGSSVRGLELGGRLAAISQSGEQFLVNAAIYTLMQPGSLATRFVAP